MRVFNAMVVATLLDGCETWTMQSRLESKLPAFEEMCLRRVEGVTRLDRVSNKVRKTLAWARSNVGHGEGEANKVEIKIGANRRRHSYW